MFTTTANLFSMVRKNLSRSFAKIAGLLLLHNPIPITEKDAVAVVVEIEDTKLANADSVDMEQMRSRHVQRDCVAIVTSKKREIIFQNGQLFCLIRQGI